MEILIYAIAAGVAGFTTGWFVSRTVSGSRRAREKEMDRQKYHELDKEFTAFRTLSEEQSLTLKRNLAEKVSGVARLEERTEKLQTELTGSQHHLVRLNALLDAKTTLLEEKNSELEKLRADIAGINASLDLAKQELATARANNSALGDSLAVRAKEMEELGVKFNKEFENIANKILEVKTEKFTELNKANMQDILRPLGENISEFKKTVAEVYDRESKERFSLSEKVKELAQLNQVISEEARNLTRALKGEAKTQGRWGEMILESILEKSGLRKDEEYFLEHQLTDAEGNPLRSGQENRKMRPDAVIKYPGERSVIIDAKVSLNAFSRYLASDDPGIRKKELTEHVTAVKNHILVLSSRGYDDYSTSPDFVMMFIPSEPAYMAALRGEPDIWNFAYEKRILLINPTNLIISLKLIVDLWKREYQNRNAQLIAERGAKLYDKFVGFVGNLKAIGDNLDKAKDAWTTSYKQLSTGNDNLVLQATKLKNLGLKTKRELGSEATGGVSDPELSA